MSNSDEKVISVDRAFQIMDLLARSACPLGITSIVTELKLPKVTTFRILNALVENNLLIKHDDDTYSLGIALVALGECARNSFSAKSLAEPYVKELCSQIGETVSLSINYKNSCLDVFSMDGEFSFITIKASPIADLYVCAAGKVFLAHMPEADLKKYFEAELPKRTENTITTYEDFLKTKETILSSGIAYETEEFEYGYYSAAVPVYSADNNVICTLQMATPLSRIKRKDQTFIDNCIKSAADKLSTVYKKAMITQF